MIGVHYEDNHVATGFGNHLARPILRDEWHENLSFEDGVKLLEKCMRVLLYRDRSAVNKLQASLMYNSGPAVCLVICTHMAELEMSCLWLLHTWVFGEVK